MFTQAWIDNIVKEKGQYWEIFKDIRVTTTGLISVKAKVIHNDQMDYSLSFKENGNNCGALYLYGTKIPLSYHILESKSEQHLKIKQEVKEAWAKYLTDLCRAVAKYQARYTIQCSVKPKDMDNLQDFGWQMAKGWGIHGYENYFYTISFNPKTMVVEGSKVLDTVPVAPNPVVAAPVVLETPAAIVEELTAPVDEYCLAGSC
jgi:hypothetical protein